MTARITVRYKCLCKKEEARVTMKGRGSIEALESFMQRMGMALQKHHLKHSPGCMAAQTEYVKIPTSADGVLGRD